MKGRKIHVFISVYVSRETIIRRHLIKQLLLNQVENYKR